MIEKVDDDDDSGDGTHVGPIIASSSFIGFIFLTAGASYLLVKKQDKSSIVEVHSPNQVGTETKL